jgi:hypothetical protein
VRIALALVALPLALWGACSSRVEPIPGGGQREDAGAVYQACDSICVRPGDCAQAFNDEGICPPGFLCALRYGACTTD